MRPDRPQRVFISRTTTGLARLADEVADVLRGRGIEVIIQTEFLPHWRDVRGMLQEKLIDCDAVICLIGPVHGVEPDDPVTGLRDERVEGRRFSYTQIEFLIARDLPRPVFTFLVSGEELVEVYSPEPEALVRRQREFIREFACDGRSLYYRYSERSRLLNDVREMDIPRTALAGKPSNLPYATLCSLFKGRENFLESLGARLRVEGVSVIHGRQAIHGMGGVGKTRAAVEYAWRHAEDYRALLFVAADSPEALDRNLAALCGPLVLNLPEQDAREQEVQTAAAVKWLKTHPGWFLIIDNVDTPAAAEAVEHRLAVLGEGHVVITSRIADWSGQVDPLELDVLDRESAAAFLLERTEGRRVPAATEESDARELAGLLDGLPLALEQAAAYVREQRLTLADYIRHWREVPEEAIAWHDAIKMQYPRSLAITYETSVEQLSYSGAELFRQLAWLAPDPVPITALQSAALDLPGAGDEKSAARAALLELDALHLARLNSDGESFAVHRLIQEITRQKQERGIAGSPADIHPPALFRTLNWMNSLFIGDPDDVRFWPVLEPLASHALTVAAFADAYAVADPTARLMNQVGILLKTKARNSEAEPLMRRVLVIFEESLGPDHPRVAAALNNLVQLLQATNRLAEAEPLIRRALAIDEQAFGPDHPEVAIDLNNLAQLLQATNRLAEAEQLMRRALAIVEQPVGMDHPNAATALSNLAQLLQATNRRAEAEPLMRRALSIDEQSYGTDHPAVARDLNNLAGLLQATDRLAEAEPLMRRALAIEEQAFGPDHPDVARDLNNLAGLLEATNRLAEAEPLFRRALAIVEQAFTPDHPEVAIRLSNLAQLLKTTNRLADAEPLMLRSLNIDESAFGPDHPKVAIRLGNLAGLLQFTNRLAEAEPLMRRARAIDEEAYGPDHPKVAIRLNNLAALLQETKRQDEAEPLMHRALAIDEMAYGPDHSKVAIRLNNLAGLFLATHRQAEAEPLIRRQLEIFLNLTRANGHPHPHLNATVNNYTLLLQAMGRTVEQIRTTLEELGGPFGIEFG